MPEGGVLTPVVLGALAVLLARPVPDAQRRLTGLRRTPAAAMLLWQATTLAAVLAALGAGLSLVTVSAWPDGGAVGLLEYAAAGAAALVTAVVAGRLLLSGHRVGRRLRTLRRHHRDRVDVVAARARDGVRVLDVDLPVAYCLPGAGRSRVVVSAGALAQLGPAELAAVLAHERAHLRARHDLVLEAFTVLQQAFPRPVVSRAALAEVRLLVEVLADRRAARGVGAAPLGRALLVLARGGGTPEASLGAAGGDLVTRVELLGDLGPHRLQALLVVLAAVLVVALPTLLVVVPWFLSLA